MADATRPAQNKDTQINQQKNAPKRKLVDVATLDKSVATSETDASENSNPVAVGEAGG